MGHSFSLVGGIAARLMFQEIAPSRAGRSGTKDRCGPEGEGARCVALPRRV
jgi:hypothetical protein